MRPLDIEFIHKIIELGLLLQAVLIGWLGGVFVQGEMHAFMTAILLRMAWFDALDGNAASKPEHR